MKTGCSFVIQRCVTHSASPLFAQQTTIKRSFMLFDFNLSFFSLLVFLFTYELMAHSYAYITEIVMLIHSLSFVLTL